MQTIEAKKEEKKSWFEASKVYFQWPILCVLIIGFSSGFPLLLTGSTFVAWLTKSGIDVKAIGFLSLIGIFYTLKFFISPFVDSIHLFGRSTHLEHRKRWCALTQLLLALSLVGISMFDPATNLLLVVGFALAIALFSATQDIIVDALRIELVKKDDQGAGAATYIAGYRIGMLIAGAGALFLVDFFSDGDMGYHFDAWHKTYLISAGIMLLCLILSWTCIKRLYGYEETKDEKNEELEETTSVFSNFVDCIKDFISRPGALIILIFIAIFKLGEAMAGNMSMKFYLDIQFSLSEIAAISKIFGTIATMVGVFLGGFVVKKIPITKALLICGSLQLASNLCFVWLAYVGNHIPILTICITIENVTGGMNTVAFVAFISQLCSAKFTATQYAMLSAIANLSRSFLAAPSGVIVAYAGWVNFFFITVILGIPGLILLFYIAPKLKEQNDSDTGNNELKESDKNADGDTGNNELKESDKNADGDTGNNELKESDKNADGNTENNELKESGDNANNDTGN